MSIPAVAYRWIALLPLTTLPSTTDIDLLVLHDAFVTADPSVWIQYDYVSTGKPGKTVTDQLAELRAESIDILKRRYYGANVDTTGSKSICLSGGSLQRTVDVVPSHWHDTLDWKRSGNKADRDIYILDSHKHERLHNKPFMHIQQVETKCISVCGALRKVIRLLKNIRYDATPEIKLSSYDIASIAWHMSAEELRVPFGVDLLLVERARSHLKFVLDYPAYREKLWVPDRSRKIYEKPETVTATTRLYEEVDQLVKDIYRELDPFGQIYDRPVNQVLAKAIYL